MNNNHERNATVAGVVVLAGASAHLIYKLAKTKRVTRALDKAEADYQSAVANIQDSTTRARAAARHEINKRLFDGYYDDKPDGEMQLDQVELYMKFYMNDNI